MFPFLIQPTDYRSIPPDQNRMLFTFEATAKAWRPGGSHGGQKSARL
jgi:hypothetical protein